MTNKVKSMSSIVYVSDPHIGTRRAAHTTTASQAALEQAIYDHARTVLQGEEGNTVIMAGDLFDKANNSERVVSQGLAIANMCDVVLSGNHDELNREGHVSSLQLIHGILRAFSEEPTTQVVDRHRFDAVEVTWLTDSDPVVCLIPHHPTQALFEQALHKAAQGIKALPGDKVVHLVLHCNYDMPFDNASNTSLNLTRECAQELLEAGFDYILLGHEHNPRSDLDGRVQVLGNMHPTSFSDVSDKYLWRVGRDGAPYKELIWSEEEHSAVIEVGTPLDEIPVDAQFITITGSRGAADGQDVNLYLQAVREARPDAFMIRSVVALKDHLADLEIDTDAAPVIGVDLSARIAKDLEGSDLFDLWNELAKECQA